MAVGTGTLTVNISESVTLGGKRYGSSVTETIASINDVFERIITCPTSEIVLYLTHASVPQGYVFDKDLVKYIRVTNHDATNFVSLRVTDSNNDEFVYKLEAGQSFVLWGHAASMSAADAATAGTANADIASIEAQADTAACDLEVIVATT